MATTIAAARDLGAPAPDFSLSDSDGRTQHRDSLRGPNGLVLMFICNHCPYVLAIADKIATEGAALQALGFGVAAVCSNDATSHPQDGFAHMGPFARRHDFAFPYLHDPDQTLARACGAACTPEFFGYGPDLSLSYRGRLDDSGRSPKPAARRELYEAMRLVAETGRGPLEQTAAIGCSIKWKAV